MTLMSPPEGVLLQDLELLEVLTHPPSLIVSECQTILLEQGVDSRNTVIPTILQVIKCETSILSLCFGTFQCILGPNPLGVLELTLPGVDVAVQIGYQLILLMTHTGSVMGDAGIGLFAET